MSDIWKIWKIEFRKQRWEWIVSLVSLVILGILLFFLNNNTAGDVAVCSSLRILRHASDDGKSHIINE